MKINLLKLKARIRDSLRGWSAEDLVAAYEALEEGDRSPGSIIYLSKRQFRALIADDNYPATTTVIFKRNHLNYLFEVRASKHR